MSFWNKSIKSKYCQVCKKNLTDYNDSFIVFSSYDINDFQKYENSIYNYYSTITPITHSMGINASKDSSNEILYLYDTSLISDKVFLCSNKCGYNFCIENNKVLMYNDFEFNYNVRCVTPHIEEINVIIGNKNIYEGLIQYDYEDKFPLHDTNFETKRLLIRYIEDSDYNNLYKILSDAETMKLFDSANKIPKDVNEFIHSMKHMNKYESSIYVICLHSKPNNLIGFCSLIGKEDGLFIEYAISKNYWNQGIISEALHPIINYCKNSEAGFLLAVTELTNKVSQHVLEKFEFNSTGIKPLLSYDGTSASLKIFYKRVL